MALQHPTKEASPSADGSISGNDASGTNGHELDSTGGLFSDPNLLACGGPNEDICPTGADDAANVACGVLANCNADIDPLADASDFDSANHNADGSCPCGIPQAPGRSAEAEQQFITGDKQGDIILADVVATTGGAYLGWLVAEGVAGAQAAQGKPPNQALAAVVGVIAGGVFDASMKAMLDPDWKQYLNKYTAPAPAPGVSPSVPPPPPLKP